MTELRFTIYREDHRHRSSCNVAPLTWNRSFRSTAMPSCTSMCDFAIGVLAIITIVIIR